MWNRIQKEYRKNEISIAENCNFLGKGNTYREIFENNLIQEGAYGVKNGDIDAVTE